jgi:hypothetical protein
LILGDSFASLSSCKTIILWDDASVLFEKMDAKILRELSLGSSARKFPGCFFAKFHPNSIANHHQPSLIRKNTKEDIK